jgi:hypothetical protein
MKQAEAKVRFLSRALILAAMIAVLGTCEGGFVEDTPKTDEIGQKPGDMVTVRVRTGGGNSPGRSLAAEGIETAAEDYEVVFRHSKPIGNRPEYYRGEGTAVKGYASVSVPINDPADPDDFYDVLFLAGTNHTLLAAGYSKKEYIEADTVNSISIDVKSFPLQWDTQSLNVIVPSSTADLTKSTNDFEFFADISKYTGAPVTIPAKHRQINLANDGTTAPPLGGTVNNINSADTFGVKFNVAKLDPLIEVDFNTDPSSRALTIANDPLVRLRPRYVQDSFTPVPLPIDITGDGTDGKAEVEEVDVDDDTIDDSYKITIADGNSDGNLDPVFFVTKTSLPSKDEDKLLALDGLLQFELKYYAFGTPKSNGTAWRIRNGIDRSLDATYKEVGTGPAKEIGTGNGGLFLVRFGIGSSADNKTVIVDGP